MRFLVRAPLPNRNSLLILGLVLAGLYIRADDVG